MPRYFTNSFLSSFNNWFLKEVFAPPGHAPKQLISFQKLGQGGRREDVVFSGEENWLGSVMTFHPRIPLSLAALWA